MVKLFLFCLTIRSVQGVLFMCLPSGQLDLLCATYFLTDATTSRRSTAASEMRCDASGEITISRNQLRGTATTQGTRV